MTRKRERGERETEREMTRKGVTERERDKLEKQGARETEEALEIACRVGLG